MHAFELTTEPLNIDQLKAMVSLIVRLMRAWGHDRITVTYGYACKLPVDQLWHPIKIDTLELGVFIQQSIAKGVFQFGQCDLHIEDPEQSVEFRFCHESDMHFVGLDRRVVDQVVQVWQDQGLTIYVSEGPKGSGLPKQWKLVGSASQKS